MNPAPERGIPSKPILASCLLALVLVLAALPVTAAATGKVRPSATPGGSAQVQWQEATGIQEYRDSGGDLLLRRSVTVRLANTGAYWVHTESLDESGASETVAYDGAGAQEVLIKDPGGNLSAYSVDGSGPHFAITKPPTGTSSFSSITDSSSASGERGSVSFGLTSEISAVTGSPAKLQLGLPAGVTLRASSELNGAAANDQSRSQTRSAGSSRATYFNYFTNEICAYGYHYRNSTTNFSTAHTRRGPGCSYVQVSVWAQYVFFNFCLLWQGTGNRDIVYSTWSGYFEVDPDKYACSLHAAWGDDWTLHVGWRPLAPPVRG